MSGKTKLWIDRYLVFGILALGSISTLNSSIVELAGALFHSHILWRFTHLFTVIGIIIGLLIQWRFSSNDYLSIGKRLAKKDIELLDRICQDYIQKEYSSSFPYDQYEAASMQALHINGLITPAYSISQKGISFYKWYIGSELVNDLLKAIDD